MRRLVIQKRAIHKQYRSTGDLNQYYLFCDIRNQCRILRDRCYGNYINNIENNISKNPKSFWTYVKDKNNCHSVPLHVSYDGVTSNGAADMVNLFASFFSTVYNPNDVREIPYSDLEERVAVTNYSVSLSEVFDVIGSLPYIYQ